MNTYIRLDGNNRPINSTNKLFKEKPKQGKWVKINLTENYCCDSTTYTVTPGATTGTDWTLTISCASGNVLTFVNPGEATTIAELVTLLNTNFSYVAQFSVADNGTDINVRLNSGVLVCNDTVTITIDLTA